MISADPDFLSSPKHFLINLSCDRKISKKIEMRWKRGSFRDIEKSESRLLHFREGSMALKSHDFESTFVVIHL